MNIDVNIKELIHSSYSSAIREPINAKSRGKLHSTRSQVWVAAVAKQFKSRISSDHDIRVFSKGDSSNRDDFGLNELLFDVTVCRVGTVESAKQRKTLYYVCDVLWQVESEFAKNSRQALIDFNKLVLGSAQNKLFIGPQVFDNTSFIDVLLPAAKVCQGRVFTALVPHPDSWEDENRKIDIWELEGGKWMHLGKDG